jgi:hypothetical protein
MSRFAGPGWRVAGAFVGWALFVFCFTVLYQGVEVLSGIGGYCASGGPYVIQTECPAAVMWALPVGFIGAFVAWMLAFFLQKGFSAPVVVWAWPILFVGLGIEFFLSIPLSGAFVGILCGTLFVIMGLAPLIFELRAGPQRIILGRSNLRDVRFAGRENAPRTFYAFGRDPDAVTVVPTIGDWAISLLVSVAAIVLGASLGILVFSQGGAA